MKTWLSLVFFSLAAMLVFISYLPELAEQFLLPPLLKKTGLAEYQVSVYRLGINGCTLRVSGKKGSSPIISAGNVQLVWSLGGLLQKKLDLLVVHGLQVNYRPRNQSGPSLQNSSAKIKVQAERTEVHPASPGLPFIVDQIQVIDSLVVLQNTMGVQRLPFSVVARRVHNGDVREQDFILRYKVNAKAAGQEVFADISYGDRERSLTGTATGSIDLLGLLRELNVKLPFAVDVEGNGEITVQADMRVAPFSIENLQVEALLKDQLVVEQGESRIRVQRLSVEAHLVPDGSGKKNSLTTRLQLYGDGLSVTAPGLRFTIPRVQLSGESRFQLYSDEQQYVFSGKLEFGDGLLTMDEQEVVLQGIKLEFPVTWPLGVDSNDGFLQIPHIVRRNTEMGHFYGTWGYSPESVTLKGELQSGFMPESKVVLTGIFSVPSSAKPLADVQFKIADAPVSLARFVPLFPALDVISGTGLLNMEGQVALYPGRVANWLKLDLHEGSFEVPEADLKAEGVRLNLEFPDLSSWDTSPAQKLSLDRITNKKLVMTDIKSSFRLESLQSLFVEKLSGHWSKGRLFSSSFRLQKEKPDFEAALFFDRLELAEILSQLGLAQAEGSGRVSGRVPIRFRDGKLYVDNGFLYTVPGEKGILKVKNSEHLGAGIPADVPQFSPLYFASAALRDFEYNWAKLLVFSEDEDLILQLQIDGKPAERLPFRFDQQNNAFVRLKEGSSGGIDQPVKLDINFKVPANELFRYQQQLMPILRKIR